MDYPFFNHLVCHLRDVNDFDNELSQCDSCDFRCAFSASRFVSFSFKLGDKPIFSIALSKFSICRSTCCKSACMALNRMLASLLVSLTCWAIDSASGSKLSRVKTWLTSASITLCSNTRAPILFASHLWSREFFSSSKYSGITLSPVY